MAAHVDVLDLISRLTAAEEPFALATVVRTVSVTAAKACAKAIIRSDGRIEAGWIGGGCARGAVLKPDRLLAFTNLTEPGTTVRALAPGRVAMLGTLETRSS